MDPAPAPYMIRINGHLGATVLSAFPALAPQHYGAYTVLTGLLDQSALYGVLAEIEALGLELLEIRKLTSRPHISGTRSPALILTATTVGRVRFATRRCPTYDQWTGSGWSPPTRWRSAACCCSAALLNTIFASAVASYLTAHLAAARLIRHRALTGLALAHGYDTAFWWIAGIFATGAVIAGALLRRGPLRSVSTPTAADDRVTTAQAEASRERAP